MKKFVFNPIVGYEIESTIYSSENTSYQIDLFFSPDPEILKQQLKQNNFLTD